MARLRPWLLFAFGIVAAVALYHQALFASVLTDEIVYSAAIDAVRRGVSPTSVAGWLYPLFVAKLGAWLARPLGVAPVLYAVRAANLLGTVLVVVLAAERLWARGAPLVIVALLISPIGRYNLVYGNVSGLLTGATVLALFVHAPRLRSITFLLGVIPKPYGLAVWLTRPWREWVLPAAATAAIYATAGRGSFGNLDSPGNAALVRALHELGLPVPWQLVTSAVLVAALASRDNALRGLCLAWLSLPLVWQHTAILLLVPWTAVTAVALGKPHSQARVAQLIAWTLVGVVISTTKWWGIPEGPRWASGLLGLIPSAAAIAIAIHAPTSEPPIPVATASAAA